jgi:hypothetical protein
MFHYVTSERLNGGNFFNLFGEIRVSFRVRMSLRARGCGVLGGGRTLHFQPAPLDEKLETNLWRSFLYHPPPHLCPRRRTYFVRGEIILFFLSPEDTFDF